MRMDESLSTNKKKRGESIYQSILSTKRVLVILMGRLNHNNALSLSWYGTGCRGPIMNQNLKVQCFHVKMMMTLCLPLEFPSEGTMD